MEKGQILEQGTYNELINKEGGEFSRLMSSYGGVDGESSSYGAKGITEAKCQQNLIDAGRIGKGLLNKAIGKELMKEEERNVGNVKGRVKFCSLSSSALNSNITFLDMVRMG